MSPGADPNVPIQGDIDRGLALHRAGAIGAALDEFEKALQSAPGHEQAHLLAGVANLQLGRWSRGVAHLRVAVAANPLVAEAWSNLAHGYRELGRSGEAEVAVKRALSIDPGLAEAWNLAGLVQQDLGDLESAEAHFRKALELRPSMALAMMNLANCAQARGLPERARQGYLLALELDRDIPEAHYNLAHLDHKIGRLEEAIAGYQEAIRLRPDYSLAHHNLSHVLFLLGRFDAAWIEHAWRPPRMTHIANTKRKGGDQGLLPQGRLDGARLLILAEQGLGDVLFYLRYARFLRDRGATLDFAGDVRLLDMIRRSGLFAGVSANADEIATPLSVRLLAGDLPLLLPGIHVDGYVPEPFALQPLPGRIDAARNKLRMFGPPPYIAIAWRAGEPKVGPVESLYKEIPPSQLGAALRGLHATLVSVQREPRAGESSLFEAAAGSRLHDASSSNVDLEEALAFMAVVDTLVGVSNTNVHLRAGVGGGGHILLPFPPEWRWMASGRSPWFGEFASYRQDPSGHWGNALAELSRSLASKFRCAR